ncbi:hypothetical protein [Helicobacter sp. 13S00477-4]|uniref:hypothetical protein n=1 Tax=Helicobacter sp. 13S00477-4 TaxID=1905759 RepID=UPI000BA5E4C9|nr:hypothetical protein [Helicobacter sp. 13S00477-4]PAF51962.1 hypothetical protein BKH44_04690 [Helicobacter sp. 13S00477-4]
MDILKNYDKLSDKHCIEYINFLCENDIHFSILCDFTSVSFDPILPEEISNKFSPLIWFILAGYTFESIKSFQDLITFEAGFGQDNIGSIVTVLIKGIMQIIIKSKRDEDIILFNRYALDTILEIKNTDSIQDSMEAILSNPKNRKIIKNLQKNSKN